MSPESPYTLFRARHEALQARVNDAAQSLHTRGLRPTVARVRAALGGGSPNDLTPALKHWRDSILPTLPSNSEANPTPTIPPPITDLARELWRRAIAAATTEIKGSSPARRSAAQTEEIQALRNQLNALRDQLEKESLAHGALRAQATRYEVIAREALARAQASDSRERTLLHEVGSLRQKVAELEAAARYRRTAARPRPTIAIRRGAKRPRRRPQPSTTNAQPRPRLKQHRK
jgi:Plasmid replication region DNA-binding N-term